MIDNFYAKVLVIVLFKNEILLKQHWMQNNILQERMKNSNIIKCVLIGDDMVGKTSLLITYSSNIFPHVYVPSVLDTYVVNVNIENDTYRLGLYDTASQYDYENNLIDADIFIVCFSLNSSTSLQNVDKIWIPKLEHFNSKASILLVGLQSDVKKDILSIKANQIAQQKQLKYIECSAKTNNGVNNVFNQSILIFLNKNKSLCEKIISTCILL